MIQSGNIVVFDFGNDTVKISYINPEMCLSAVKVIPIKHYDNNKRQFLETARNIKGYLAEQDFPTNNAVVCFSSKELFIKRTEVKCTQNDDLPVQVNNFIQNNTPFSLHDIATQYRVIGKKEMQGVTYYDVLLMMIPSSVVERYGNIVKSLGFSLEMLAINPLCIASLSSVIPQYKDKTFMLLDLGEQSIDLIFIKKAEFSFYRSIALGGEALTKEIQDYYHVSKEEAEQKKRRLNLRQLREDHGSYTLGEKKPEQVIEPILDMMITDIRRSIGYFINNEPGNEIEHIYLLGGNAYIADIDKYLTEYLGVPASCFPYPGENVISSMVSEELDRKALADRYLQLVPMLGLLNGLKEKTLPAFYEQPEEDRVMDEQEYSSKSSSIEYIKEKFGTKVKTYGNWKSIKIPGNVITVVGSAVILTVILLTYVYMRYSVSALEARLEANNVSINTLSKQADEVKGIQRRINDLQSHLVNSENVLGHNTLKTFVSYLNRKYTDGKLIFTRMEYRKSKKIVQIIGEASQAKVLSEFITALQDDSSIGRIEIVYISQKSTSYEFELSAGVK